MSVLSKATSGTGYGCINTEDALMAPAFLIGTLTLSGIATIQLFEYDLASTAFSLGETAISWAFLISALAVVFAWITNEPDLSKMDDEYTYLAGGMVALLLAHEFVPTVSDLITGSDMVGLIAVALMSAGYYAVAYLG